MKYFLFITSGLLLACAGCATAQDQTNLPASTPDMAASPVTDNTISPRADSVLRSACDFLAQTPAFSFKGEIWREHVNAAGQKIQFSRSVQMDVKRPDGMRLELSSPSSTRGSATPTPSSCSGRFRLVPRHSPNLRRPCFCFSPVS